jgi:hypothetical protein
MDESKSIDELGPQRPLRVWSVTEANERIHELGDLLAELRAWVERLRVVHQELLRLNALWGSEIDAKDIPDRRHKDRLDQEAEALRERIEETVNGLQGEGIEIKDLERGLVDFYARLDDELVYLCWRVDEEEVAFYHTLDSGFRGRRPIPRGA